MLVQVMRSRPLLAASVALAVTLAGACTDDPSPEPGASATTSGSTGGSSPTTTGGGEGGSGGSAGGSAGMGGQGGMGLSDPAVFQTVDQLVVCGPTAAQPCMPSDMAWVASEYGSTVTRVDDAGAVAYRLVALVEREGPSNIDVLVVDDSAAPVVGVPVAFYFSSAPESSRPDEWYPVKVTSNTGSNGVAGFALAPSAYLSCCGCGGPHAVWVSEAGAMPDTSVPSDLADKLGMLGGTNHRHLELIFQRTVAGETPSDAVRCPLF